MKKQTHIIIGICMLFLLAAGLLLWYRKPVDGSAEEFFSLEQGVQIEAASIPSVDSALTTSGSDITEPEVMSDCAVYISGAVKKPGLFHYHGSARLSDAVEATGGFRKNAAREAVNLARLLVDGEQIHIPTRKEAKTSHLEIITEKDTQTTEGNAGDLVNINTAPLNELQSLPGIGASRAELIIQYRTEHGPYTDKKDLMQISGIKEGIFQKIETLITI